MQRNVLGLLPLLAALAAISMSGCRPVEESTGSAQFITSVQQALSASEVSRVTVTLTAADLPTRTVELEQANGQWGGLMGHIQAGTGRTFTAEAFNASGTKLYAGQVTGVTITKGQTAAVALVLQQVQASPPFQNAVPIIDSLVASGSSALPGGRLTLQASAHDPNPSDTLTYVWTASAGTLASPTSATTEWTAPQQAGQVTLTLAVTDPHGSVATLSMKLPVRNGVGDADLDISFNNWPVVARLSASPSRVEVGQGTVVTATASDSDGDALGYQWSAEGCTGTWTEASGNTARFTPDAAPVDGPCSCRLGVQVGDGRGGTGQGTLSMCVGGAVGPSFPPEVVESFQSATKVSAQGTVRLRVEGQDPQGGALFFSWAADAGALGVPVNDATTSEVVWTAPACLDALSASLTVTLSNAVGLTASHVFQVYGLPECTPLPSGTWAAVGGMNATGLFHAATLLPSGEVLFAGRVMGWTPPWGSVAEVYNPATNRSVATGGGPSGMTAAVWLPSGKALASGGASAQLFDPATRGWSAAGTVANDEHHRVTLTLLPSGKVLLAGGYDGSTGQPLATARLYDVATGTWTDTQPMLQARSGHTATLLPSGKVLVTGGEGPEGVTTEVYDPGTGSWAPATSMAFHRAYHTALVLPSGKVLVVGGAGGPALAEVYDPETDTWLPAGGSTSTCEWRTATLLPSGKVLVTGCQGLSSSQVSTAEVYDPVVGTWTPTGNLNDQRSHYTATLLPSGKVLVTGGTHSGMEVYDPATGGWSRLDAVARYRSDHTAVLLPSGKVLVAGGGGEADSLAELYDPATTAWTPTGAMLSDRAAHTATLLPSGKVLVVGGISPNDGRLASAEVYDPAAGTWTPTGSLSGGRSGHTATLLPSGRVLVVGGEDSNRVALTTAEVYDAATGTWTPTGSLNVGRAGHTATLLPSGQVMVVGGKSSRVEVYDPVLGSWTLKAELQMGYELSATLLASGRVLLVTYGGMVSGVVEYDPETDTVEWIAYPLQPRTEHTATLLASGKVLIAGGGPPTTVTELYDPATKTWSSTGDFGSFRIGHTATRLASGQVLVVGGYLAGEYYALATVYTP
jgi:WD40 repeat protein